MGLVLSLSLPLLSFAAVTNQEVEEALTCQCGCGLTVHSCNHLQCGFAVPAKKRIADLVAQGKGKEEITAVFVMGDGESPGYGEKVLSSPTTSGFNLAAWITPFLAVLGGGIMIGFISLRWSRRRRDDTAAPQSLAATVDRYRDRLKKELDSFEG
ncbi:MAG: cytochrome c-type biogenesis protein CcmH [Deltaproteobacteria bacterium]|nr:cytochrome c-type biogenesis protein CcmH [Deltaproteobacteria bacterium]